MMAAGRIFTVVGPSGVGKDTLMAAAAARRPDLYIVRRVITRAADAGGEPFQPVSEAEFARMKEQGAFALDWQAHGLSYGIPAEIDAALDEGRDVIFNGSRGVLADALRRYPGLRVILMSAQPATLAARLAARGRESAEEVAARLGRAGYAVPEGVDMVEISNDGALEEAVEALLDVLQPESV